MDRTHLRKLAQTRLDDAAALLNTGRWAGAYYLSGYVIECGLKVCLLRHLGESGAVFGDEKYLRRLSECWTHDLVKLVNLAGLDVEFGMARGVNPALEASWAITKDWKETSRYEERSEVDAKALCQAVSQQPDGVFQWIQSRW